MLGLLLFLFQTIQMVKLCFKLKVKKKKKTTATENQSLPSPKKSNLKPITKVKTRLF